MGERLNIEIKKGDKLLANSYYHWSGYTSSSLELTEMILQNIDKIQCENEVINAVKLLEITGAGLTDREIEWAKENIHNFSNYKIKECLGRNEGLIGISENEMAQTERWEEERVEIDILNRKVKFDAIWIITREEYKADYEDDSEEELYDDIPIYDIDFYNISFDDFPEFKKLIMFLIDNEIYRIRLKDNENVYGFVE